MSRCSRSSRCCHCTSRYADYRLLGVWEDDSDAPVACDVARLWRVAMWPAGKPPATRVCRWPTIAPGPSNESGRDETIGRTNLIADKIASEFAPFSLPQSKTAD